MPQSGGLLPGKRFFPTRNPVNPPSEVGILPIGGNPLCNYHDLSGTSPTVKGWLKEKP